MEVVDTSSNGTHLCKHGQTKFVKLTKNVATEVEVGDTIEFGVHKDGDESLR